MMTTTLRILASAAACFVFITLSVRADSPREATSSETAQTTFTRCVTEHRMSKLGLSVSNMGILGTGFDGFSNARSRDCFSGQRAISCAYPRGVDNSYLYGGSIWIGGILGNDTLVSTGADGWGAGIKHSLDNGGYVWRNLEFYPPLIPEGKIIRRSTMNPLSPAYEGAVSEEDIIANYTDTNMSSWSRYKIDAFEGRRHKPLGLSIIQSSYAWTYSYTDDFILINYEIENIGDTIIKEAYMGILMDGDVWGEGNRDRSMGDDVTGFRRTRNWSRGECEFEDSLNLAWIADNNGDVSKLNSVRGVLGTRFLRAPEFSAGNVSYNWWSSNFKVYLDFGPRRKNSPEHPFRDLRTGGLGTPEGDRNKYHFLSSGEIDYDQIYTYAISPNDPTWLYPPRTVAPFITRGYDISYLQAVGPFDIEPGEIMTVTIAFVAAENFHHKARNYQRHLQTGTYLPDQYMDGLNWAEFEQNAAWAGWVYDNPGVDTDNDGYFGRYHLCCADSTIDTIIGDENLADTLWTYGICDTIWYEGDQIPDFRGANPPPAPKVWVYPSNSKLRVRFNGHRSQTTPDVFSRLLDFDGYRVYLGHDDRQSSFSLMATYDLENYVQLVYNWTSREFDLLDDPFSLEELICMYGQSCDDYGFDPRQYTKGAPLVWGDSLVYFAPQDYNRSELGVTTPITRIYPEATLPPYDDPTLVPDDSASFYLTEDGFFRYYEYEYTITNLLPTIPYFVNVTAFDYGSPKSGLGSLESAVTLNPTEAYPLVSGAEADTMNLAAYVYPNPYLIDGGYLGDGFEGRDGNGRSPERMRRIHFANLPPRCVISIFSLDGDLIKAIDHDQPADSPTAAHEEWNLINRNSQPVVTGIYYWVIEEPKGETQLGKLVIIK